jgi:hypothetical protein
MKGAIKYAKVSIKYKQKTRGKRLEVIKTRPVEVIVTIQEEPRALKFKSRTISRVCRHLNLNPNKIIEPTINSIEIIKDLGRTAYDINGTK